jgi:hypothetical protein
MLFHNGGNGKFEDVTARSGTGSTGWTLATTAIDVDHKGFLDLFVANDYGRSELFHNNGDGTFTECGRKARVDDRGSSMNATPVDITGDGWMGLYVTQIDMFSKSIGFVFPTDADHITVNERILKSTFYLSGNKLFANQQDGTFKSVESQLFEPGDRGWAWSANFFDYDNDGEEDCYMTNGWLDGTPAGRQAHQFFIRHDGRFFQWDRGGAQNYTSNARGCAAVDLTGRGHLDLVVSDFAAAPHLLINASTDANGWLKVKLHGVHANRQGIGAAVHVMRDDGKGLWKQVTCGSNYLSQDDTTLTFGLGSLDHAKLVEVRWPDGHLQTVTGPIPGRSVLEVVEQISATRSPVHTTR